MAAALILLFSFLLAQFPLIGPGPSSMGGGKRWAVNVRGRMRSLPPLRGLWRNSAPVHSSIPARAELFSATLRRARGGERVRAEKPAAVRTGWNHTTTPAAAIFSTDPGFFSRTGDFFDGRQFRCPASGLTIHTFFCHPILTLGATYPFRHDSGLRGSPFI